MISSLLFLLFSLAGAELPLFRTSVVPGSDLTSGLTSKDWIIEVNGGGLCVADFNHDGLLDVVLVDGSTPARTRAGKPGLPPRLLLNQGGLHFGPAAPSWKIEAGRWGMGGAAGDLNGDGHVDLVITNWGADQVVLNTGEGFEKPDRDGLVGERWGTSCALFDYDLDGVLDLFVANYLEFDFEEIAPREDGACIWKGVAVNCGPEGLTPEADQLYRGLGDGRFEDVTIAMGIDAAPPAFGLGVVTGDFDFDGDQDVYVSCDSMPNQLWENGLDEGGTGFNEVGLRRGVAVNANGREEAGMGVAAGDLDGDGQTDFAVTNFSGESHSLYLSGGRRSYRERSGPVGIGGASISLLGWGTGFADFDLDGDLDLFACHGHVYPQADRPGSDTSFAQADLLWRNIGDKDRIKFRPEVMSEVVPFVSRAGVSADLDGDGDLDLLTIELDGPVHLSENTISGSGQHWLGVRLVDQVGPDKAVRFRSVLGARVEILLPALVEGGSPRWVIRELASSAGFQASGPEQLHFGLGAVQAISSLRVIWPGGAVEAFGTPSVDQWIRLERGGGE